MVYIMKDFSVRIKLSTMDNLVELYRVECGHYSDARRVKFDVFCRKLLDEAVQRRLRERSASAPAIPNDRS